MTDQEMYDKIENTIPSEQVFRERVASYIRGNYFPLLYQSLSEKIIPRGEHGFTSERFKNLLSCEFLLLLNDIYRTRLSKKGIGIIQDRLLTVDDFDDYEKVLSLFRKCDRATRNSKTVKKNAFSFGSKVLHTYDPEHNPILDSVVKNNLGIGASTDVNLCVIFKAAMNNFAQYHRSYFDLFRKSPRISRALKKCGVNANFPQMKILDMALYAE